VSAERLAGLLARRLREEGIAADAAVSVAELRRQLLPYPYCRERLELASKAEYDLAMLELLGDEELLDLDDPDLEEAVEREADAPEPGLGFLEDFAAAYVRPGPVLAERMTGGAGGEDGLPGERADGPDDGRRNAPRGETADGTGGDPVDGPDDGEPADIGPTGGGRPVRLVDEDEEEAPTDGGSCRACGGDLPRREDLRFCPWCGADQEGRSCEECGTELDSTWKYCPQCGEPAGG
jgi:predicted RNA-binding Zn-ribbon protein involved in translation (DUF1610 family)